MMPDAMLPAMPSAEAVAEAGNPNAALTPACSRERPKDGRWMKPGRVRRLRSDETQAAHQLCAGRNAEEQPLAAQSFALARGKQRRNNHRTRMHGSAFERVIEVFAVCCRSVDERRAKRIEAARVANRRAVPSRDRRSPAWPRRSRCAAPPRRGQRHQERGGAPSRARRRTVSRAVQTRSMCRVPQRASTRDLAWRRSEPMRTMAAVASSPAEIGVRMNVIGSPLESTSARR